MQRSHSTRRVDPYRRRSGWGLVLTLPFLAGLLALASVVGNHASGAGALVVIEDASRSGTGSFSGNVCYQVVRDSDGVTISEGCFSIAATIAAPEGLDTSQQYTIYISLADDNCVLLDDPRSGNGATPFRVRVSCDAAIVTATTTADGQPDEPADQPVEGSEGSAPVELTAWPPVYDLPTATTLEPETTEPEPMPIASPIPMSGLEPGETTTGRHVDQQSGAGHAAGESGVTPGPIPTAPAIDD